MNNKLVIAFLAGAAVGVAASWRLLKTKYEQIAQEEIDSVKEVFARKKAEMKEKEKEPTVQEEYKKIVQESGYAAHSNTENEEKGGAIVMERPYVITPDEFGEIEEYETRTLLYYADQVLTDDDDEPIEDVEGSVGRESLRHFGEYEDDSVFVRNDERRIDYEILLDNRRYSDVVAKKPPITVVADDN